nr:frataxin, mitochondrial [Ipomoea batatas]
MASLYSRTKLLLLRPWRAFIAPLSWYPSLRHPFLPSSSSPVHDSPPEYSDRGAKSFLLITCKSFSSNSSLNEGPALIDYRGPSRFDWDQNLKAWVYRRTKANLLQVLESELGKLCATRITLS